MLRRLLLGSVAILGAVGGAQATLDIAFRASNGATFTCTDNAACDGDLSTSNMLLGVTHVGPFTIEGNFSASTFGHPNAINDSNLTITNTSGSAATLTFTVGDTNFTPSTAFVNMSGSGTLNGSTGLTSSLSFHADTLNEQGGILVGGLPFAPGANLFNPSSGVIVTDPFAFSGNKDGVPFVATQPFSMTLDYVLEIGPGGSAVGVESRQVTGIPEPRTWLMAIAGFGMLGLMGIRRKRTHRVAFE